MRIGLDDAWSKRLLKASKSDVPIKPGKEGEACCGHVEPHANVSASPSGTDSAFTCGRTHRSPHGLLSVFVHKLKIKVRTGSLSASQSSPAILAIT